MIMIKPNWLMISKIGLKRSIDDMILVMLSIDEASSDGFEIVFDLLL